MFEIMKRKDIIRQIIIVLAGAVLTTACSSSDNEEVTQPAKRTVLVYMAAENNLTSNAQSDINEMIKGVKKISKWDHLIVFVDRANKTEKPFLIRLRDNDQQPADTIRKYDQDFLDSDPAKMKEVMSWVMQHYPANDYGLVIWGHANGWVVMNDSVAANRAIAVDNGENSSSTKQYWMNIPTLRNVLATLPHSFKFIFADCCNMQNAEVAFELKDVTQYVIASAAGIPGDGAPYETIVPDLFNYDDQALCQKTCDDYHAKLDNENGHLPISAVHTDRMPQLAKATAKILKSIYDAGTEINTDGMIYYYMYGNKEEEHVMYDMNDFLLRHADETEYQEWKQAFDAVFVANKMSKKWETQGTIDWDFEVTEERFGGMSMLIPLARYDNTLLKYNELIKKMGWYQAVGWSELGW